MSKSTAGQSQTDAGVESSIKAETSFIGALGAVGEAAGCKSRFSCGGKKKKTQTPLTESTNAHRNEAQSELPP